MVMIHDLFRLIRLVLLGASAALAVAGTPHVGVQALGSWSMGSMKGQFTSATGYGLGLFAGMEVCPGQVVQLHNDWIWYPEDKHAAGINGVPPVATTGADSRREHRSHSLTAQYLCYPSRDLEGIYYKVGVGIANYITRVKSTLVLPGAGAVPITAAQDTGTKLALLAGVGYETDARWGAMVQYQFLTAQNHTLGGIQAGITYRF